MNLLLNIHRDWVEALGKGKSHRSDAYNCNIHVCRLVLSCVGL